jgi:TrmH family RNA methyltransferase
MIITSKSNEKIKMIKKLQDNKDYLYLDSPKLIQEAIDCKFDLKYIIIDENRQDKFREILDFGRKNGAEIITTSQSVFSALSTTSWSQGIIGITNKGKGQVLAVPKGNFLVLDEVQDPGNVGTLIRSGLGFGFEDIYLINCASLSNEKVVRSTMGAIFHVRVYELNRQEFIDLYKSKIKMPLYAADMNGKNILEVTVKTPCGIVIGNEGNGASKELKAISDDIISIPMLNNLESLNASVAGSILMFNIATKW